MRELFPILNRICRESQERSGGRPNKPECEPARPPLALRFAAALLSAFALHAGPVAAQVPPADPEMVKIVEKFLNTPTADLPPSAVPPFLAVDPESLPKKLRDKARARRLELHTLKQLAAGKRKGSVRIPDADCEVPQEAKSGQSGLMAGAGFEEITEAEEVCVMEKTKCTERDMLCEFSLQIVLERAGKRVRRRYFLHQNDPLMAVVAGCRGSGVGGQTKFFGRGGPICSR